MCILSLDFRIFSASRKLQVPGWERVAFELAFSFLWRRQVKERVSQDEEEAGEKGKKSSKKGHWTTWLCRYTMAEEHGAEKVSGAQVPRLFLHLFWLLSFSLSPPAPLLYFFFLWKAARLKVGWWATHQRQQCNNNNLFFFKWWVPPLSMANM